MPKTSDLTQVLEWLFREQSELKPEKPERQRKLLFMYQNFVV